MPTMRSSQFSRFHILTPSLYTIPASILTGLVLICDLFPEGHHLGDDRRIDAKPTRVIYLISLVHVTGRLMSAVVLRTIRVLSFVGISEELENWLPV